MTGIVRLMMNVIFLLSRKKFTKLGLFFSIYPLFAYSSVVLPDSLLTTDKALAYCLQSPDTSHAIIDELRKKGAIPLNTLDMLDAFVYRRNCFYHQSVSICERLMNSREVQKDYHLQASVLRSLLFCHDMMMDDLSLMDDIYQLKECGENNNDPVYVAISNFVMGMRLHHHGHRDSSYQVCFAAMEVMKNSEFIDKNRTMIMCYHSLSRLFTLDGRFDEALKMSLLEEKLVRDLNSTAIYGERDEMLRLLFGHRASMLAQAGRQAQADDAYEQWRRHGVGRPFFDREILAYLLLTNRLDEGLRAVGRYKDYLLMEGDSVQVRMLDALYYDSHIYSLKDDYKMASRNIRLMASIAYQLHQMHSKKEMTARYQSLLDKERLHERYMRTLCVALVLLALLIILGILLWHNHHVHKHTLRMKHIMNYVKVYQNAALIADGNTAGEPGAENAGKAAVDTPANSAVEAGNQPESPENVPIPSEDVSLMEPFYADEDELLFMELDKKINKGQLFLDPNFSRDDMMRLIGVDKNRIGRIMSRYSMASNASTYINQKRAAYAAEYIRKHPEYTINAVVEACGMNNAVTLNRSFKELFGVSPSTYRQHIFDEESY